MRRFPCLRRLSTLMLAVCAWPWSAGADTAPEAVEFNAVFLRSPVDVSQFAEGNPVTPGLHRLDLHMNGQWKGRAEVRFALPHPQARVARPCLDRRLADLLGLDLSGVPSSLLQSLEEADSCVELERIHDGVEVRHDTGRQRLEVTAPQVALRRNARGYISPDQWDDGITAATLQYDYNAYRTEPATGEAQTSQYLGLRGGLNLGGWRLRYRSSATWSRDGGMHYQNSALYAEHAVPSWHSRLVIGESTTGGQVFDSLGFLGVQMSSDDRMYADSLRGFAPVVRGVAQSNARVRISQRGTQIYEVTVPPGPFVIDDLYPSGSGGDLLVTVTEADGSEHRFTVTYASTAELLRPGMTRYSITVGEYRSQQIDETPALMQGTWRHGLSNQLTGYGGAMAADGYEALAVGAAFNTGLGALATDVTLASTRDVLRGGREQGHSLRLTYAKILPVVNTNVTLASYRYSSRDYYEAGEAFYWQSMQKQGSVLPGQGRLDRRRNRFVFNASQALPEGYGFLSVSASTQDYWTRRGSDTEYMASYNNQMGRLSLGVSGSRTRNLTLGRWENQWMLSLSIPLGEASRAPRVSSTYAGTRHSQSLQASLSGSAGTEQQYRYHAYVAHNDHDDTDGSQTVGASGTWVAPHAHLGASMSVTEGYRQYGASMSGGVVGYGGGLVLTPLLGETIGIVEATHARDARVSSYAGIRLNGRGQAVVPYLSPYRMNQVELDPRGLSTDVQLLGTTHHVAPTAGAVALLRYETERGYSILLQGRLPDGGPLPFAAAVRDLQGRSVGYVGQGGQAILRVHESEGSLLVQWGDGTGQQCRIDYVLSEQDVADSLGYRWLQQRCEPAQ